MRELQIDGQTLTLIPDHIAEALRRALVKPGYFTEVKIEPFPGVRVREDQMDPAPYQTIQVTMTDRVRISITMETNMGQQLYFQIGEEIYRGS